MHVKNYSGAYELKNYQKEAVNDLYKNILKYFEKPEKTHILEAPTGSGKTTIVGELVKRLANESGNDLSFVWITIHKLHEQSKRRLEQYYENDRSITCSFFDELEDKMISENEILFLNWSSINKVKNVYMTPGENENDFPRIIQNTLDEGRKIVLIIDESHVGSSTAISKKIIKLVQSTVRIDVSATPPQGISNSIPVKIQHDDAKSEEMIKKLIKINEELQDKEGIDANELMIEHALRKRDELHEKYLRLNSNVNPLVLIQISNENNTDYIKIDAIKSILEKHNIRTSDGTLAEHLSKNEVNLENIEKNDSESKVMIFKQAIAQGWDCPRAAILVLFREWRVSTFSLQTVGRILRMPEIKYYDEDELNHAYIYVNYEDFEITKEITENFIFNEAGKKPNIDDVDLNSIYIKRQNQETRLDTNFDDYFEKEASKMNLATEIKQKVKPMTWSIVLNKILENAEEEINKEKDPEQEGEKLDKVLTPGDTYNVFNKFVRENMGTFANQTSSTRIAVSIEDFFKEKLNVHDYDEIHKLTIASENNGHIQEVICNSLGLYKTKIVDTIKQDIEKIVWNVPECVHYPPNYIEKPFQKYALGTAYIKKDASNIEWEFMNFLDKSEQVRWWFKNGDSGKTNFAVKYKDESNPGNYRSFYVDFIVCMNSGKIGLFDTKDGITANNENAKAKAEGLSEYIRCDDSHNLFGGIVISKNGNFLYNDSEEYDYNPNHLTDWKPLIFI